MYLNKWNTAALVIKRFNFDATQIITESSSSASKINLSFASWHRCYPLVEEMKGKSK